MCQNNQLDILWKKVYLLHPPFVFRFWRILYLAPSPSILPSYATDYIVMYEVYLIYSYNKNGFWHFGLLSNIEFLNLNVYNYDFWSFYILGIIAIYLSTINKMTLHKMYKKKCSTYVYINTIVCSGIVLVLYKDLIQRIKILPYFDYWRSYYISFYYLSYFDIIGMIVILVFTRHN